MFILIGFLDKEIEKADIYVYNTEENPGAPQPREMIDLEVGMYTCMQGHLAQFLIIQVEQRVTHFAIKPYRVCRYEAILSVAPMFC